MFTGIVQTQAIVDQIQDQPGFRRLQLKVAAVYLAALEKGASIAINGTCLTAVEFNSDNNTGTVWFDVIDESLRLTNLGLLQTGDKVNFERSLTLGKELGGHILSGHIHCTATIGDIAQSQHNCAMKLTLPAPYGSYVFSKGFIAIDGISLTVGQVTLNSDQSCEFSLHLIPETLAVTNLGSRLVGDKVNIEIDQQSYTIVQSIERILAARGLITPS
jgi:riboflavin synthase